MSTPEWVKVCAVAGFEEEEASVVPVEPPIAVFNVGGKFYATDDTCTHEKSSLADGYIDCEIVECAFHFAKFDIRNGAVLSPPASRPLRTYPTKVEDGYVWVDVTRGATDD